MKHLYVSVAVVAVALAAWLMLRDSSPDPQPVAEIEDRGELGVRVHQAELTVGLEDQSPLDPLHASVPYPFAPRSSPSTSPASIAEMSPSIAFSLRKASPWRISKQFSYRKTTSFGLYASNLAIR